MAQSLEGVDVQSAATLVTVFLGFVAAMAAGIREGLKRVKSGDANAGAKLTGGVIMDNVTMTMLSERLREAADAMRENTAAQRETSHQIERLRDRMQ